MKKPKKTPTPKKSKAKKKRKAADPMITLCPGCKQPWAAYGVGALVEDTCKLCGEYQPPETRTHRVRESSITSWVYTWIPPGTSVDTWAVFPRRVNSVDPPHYQVCFRSGHQFFDVGQVFESEAGDLTYNPLGNAYQFCDLFVHALQGLDLEKRSSR